jgi:hypothetical protein
MPLTTLSSWRTPDRASPKLTYGPLGSLWVNFRISIIRLLYCAIVDPRLRDSLSK